MTFLNRFRKLARNKRDLAKIGIKVAVKKECKWPIGHVGEKGFHFCCEEAIPGRSPYCAKHTKIAYIKPPAPQSKNQKALLSTLKV